MRQRLLALCETSYAGPYPVLAASLSNSLTRLKETPSLHRETEAAHQLHLYLWRRALIGSR
jgi:hypothetical protein